MPTFNPVSKKRKKCRLADKSTAPALQRGFPAQRRSGYRSELPTEAWRLHNVVRTATLKAKLSYEKKGCQS